MQGFGIQCSICQLTEKQKLIFLKLDIIYILEFILILNLFWIWEIEKIFSIKKFILYCW